MNRNLFTLLVSLAVAVAAYVRWVRPRSMHWGATPREAGMPLPFDGEISNPTWNATRAVTMHATPEEIWPWLVQIGWGRAGWYGYDWVDNGGKPSTWDILAEYQDVEVGKEFPMSPWTAMRCFAFDENRWMLWRVNERAGTFLWYLQPIDETSTRLVTRMRDEYRWTNPLVLPQQLAVDLLDVFFMRKCMLGVKARAERVAAARSRTDRVS